MGGEAHKVVMLVFVGVVSATYFDGPKTSSANHLSSTGGGGEGFAGGNAGGNRGFGGVGSLGYSRGGSRGGSGGSSYSDVNGGSGSIGSQSSGFGGSGGGSGGFSGSGGGSGGYNGGFGGGATIADLATIIPGGGVPGKDYPILAYVPNTGFSCNGQLPGYYADTAPEAGCQVFHICQQGGRIDSFLCPNGTIFSQQYFVCVWWFNFDCSTAQQFYFLNAEIGKIRGSGSSYTGGNINGNGFSGTGGGFGGPSGQQGSFSSALGGIGNVGAPSQSYGPPPIGGSGSVTGRGGNGNAGFNNGNGGRGSAVGNRNLQPPSGLYQVPAAGK